VYRNTVEREGLLKRPLKAPATQSRHDDSEAPTAPRMPMGQTLGAEPAAATAAPEDGAGSACGAICRQVPAKGHHGIGPVVVKAYRAVTARASSMRGLAKGPRAAARSHSVRLDSAPGERAAKAARGPEAPIMLVFLMARGWAPAACDRELRQVIRAPAGRPCWGRFLRLAAVRHPIRFGAAPLFDFPVGGWHAGARHNSEPGQLKQGDQRLCR